MSNYAVMLDMLGEEKLSIQAQHRAARLDRDNLAMAMLLIRCRRPEEALKLLEADKGGQTGPEHALVQAAALFGLGRSEEALAAIEQAGVSEEDSLSTDLIRLYKISALNQSGHPQEALTMLEGVSPEYRSKELFLIQKALSLAALARQEEAAAVAAQLAQNAVSSPNTIYLINLMRDTGLYDQAKALCLCIIDGNSRDMTYY
jgi:tetratricopeptide (TPR) repeat protein